MTQRSNYYWGENARRRSKRRASKEGRVCTQCGGPIPTSMRSDSRYCGPDCKAAARSIREKAEREEQKQQRLAARADRACARCGAAVPPERNSRAIYCSSECANDAHLKRRRGYEPMKVGKALLQCEVCDEEFTYVGGRPPRYCSQECRDSAYGSRRTFSYTPVEIPPLKYSQMSSMERRELVTKVGQCQLCASTDHLHLEHDHATDDVRGVLCTFCNTRLLLVFDHPGALSAVMDYLRHANLRHAPSGPDPTIP